MKKAFIISHQEAREIDGVIDIFRKAGGDVERINLCQYPEALTLTLRNLRESGNKPLAAGWMHNTGELSFSTYLTGMERHVAETESDAFIDAYVAELNCRWLNSPGAIKAASNKPQQLRLAEKLGLPVPEYCITNDPVELENFASERNLIMKSLATGYMHYGTGDGWKFYTQRVTVNDLLLQALRYGPQIFQGEILRAKEVRVTVVDGNCHSIGIDCSNLPENIVDIRELDYEAERKRFHVPESLDQIEALSIKLVDSLNLGYAGLDWLIDDDGRPFFLEANACGSFKWFEQCGAGDITGSIAEALLSRCYE